MHTNNSNKYRHLYQLSTCMYMHMYIISPGKLNQYSMTDHVSPGFILVCHLVRYTQKSTYTILSEVALSTHAHQWVQ